MYKKSNVNKPVQIEGIITKIDIGDELKGEYLGQDNYRIYTLHVNEQKYDYAMSVNQKMEFKEGDNVFFRATKLPKGFKIAPRSLGMKITIPQNEEQPVISDEILKKLQQRSDAIKVDETDASIQRTASKLKPKV